MHVSVLFLERKIVRKHLLFPNESDMSGVEEISKINRDGKI